MLSLLQTYLSSLNVTLKDNVYTQKEGICIGSCIAPALCDLFIVKGNGVTAVFPGEWSQQVLPICCLFFGLFPNTPNDRHIMLKDHGEVIFGRGLVGGA